MNLRSTVSTLNIEIIQQSEALGIIAIASLLCKVFFNWCGSMYVACDGHVLLAASV